MSRIVIDQVSASTKFGGSGMTWHEALGMLGSAIDERVAGGKVVPETVQIGVRTFDNSTYFENKVLCHFEFTCSVARIVEE